MQYWQSKIEAIFYVIGHWLPLINTFRTPDYSQYDFGYSFA